MLFHGLRCHVGFPFPFLISCYVFVESIQTAKECFENFSLEKRFGYGISSLNDSCSTEKTKDPITSSMVDSTTNASYNKETA